MFCLPHVSTTHALTVTSRNWKSSTPLTLKTSVDNCPAETAVQGMSMFTVTNWKLIVADGLTWAPFKATSAAGFTDEPVGMVAAKYGVPFNMTASVAPAKHSLKALQLSDAKSTARRKVLPLPALPHAYSMFVI
jgi:hypothetical protein